MTIAISSSLLSGLTDFVGAAFRGLFSKDDTSLASGDPYDPSPLDPSQMTAKRGPQSSESWYKPESLCDSERHELDTMSMIRGALYTKD